MHPINNKNFGAGKAKVFYYNGSALATGFVVKQIGTSRYVVSTDGVTNYTVSLAPTEVLAKRLDGSSALGTASELAGLATMTLTVASATKYITKLTSSAAITSDGSTYSWTLGTAAGTVYALTPHVLPATPVNTVLPAITGTAQVGQTLTTTNGTWSNSPTSYVRQWKANGAAISGATGTTYVVLAGDVGKTITVTVNAVKALTSPVAVTSVATSAVIA
jgi:hypothetical protein